MKEINKQIYDYNGRLGEAMDGKTWGKEDGIETGGNWYSQIPSFGGDGRLED